MKKNILYTTFLFFLFGITAVVDAQSHLRAPNSYVFNINRPLTTRGLYIPVKKAFDVWMFQEYLNQPIPAGSESVSLYWEDSPGLIKNVSLVGTRENAKILVEVDRAKGEGNAVIAYKVNGTVYWSWHVWVTDEPQENSYAREHGTINYKDRDVNGNVLPLKFMDRNLGAISANFLGNQWNKSAGLMYQHGRKDPFPKFINKDISYYEVDTEARPLRHLYHAHIASYSTFLQNYIRPVSNTGDSDKINDIIRTSTQNPLLPILTPRTGGIFSAEPWYSNYQYKIGNNTPDIPNDDVTHDLWADNVEGTNYYSAANSNNTKMKLKCAYDPCPNGWRVPSFFSQRVFYTSHSPWGRTNSNTSTDVVDDIQPNTISTLKADDVKFYPSLGIDFRNSSQRKIGSYSLNGKYNYYNDKLDELSFYFQDINAESNMHSGVMATHGEPRGFSMISDISRLEKNTGLGLFEISSHAFVGHGGAGVKCVKDFNHQLTTINNVPVAAYDFPTEYYEALEIDYKKGLALPNSYVLNSTDKYFEFPIIKALSVYNQYLTNKQQISGNLRANILWSSNQNLIKNIKLTNCSTIEEKYIELQLNGGELGNAIVSLENADTNEVYWSWHIWVPDGSPNSETNATLYTTEQERPMANTIGYTNSGAPPITTLFMDRNLGALYAFPDQIASNPTDNGLINKAKKSIGLFYQWGRKDPFNSFQYAGNSESYQIYKPNIDFNTSNATYGNILSWSTISSNTNLTNTATTIFAATGKKSEKITQVLHESAKNPTSLMVETASNDWLTSIPGMIYGERWGHADTKSVFDPCPEGWRMPDFTFVNLVSMRNNRSLTGQPNDAESRGTSPWYYANAGSTQTFNFNPSLVNSNLNAATKAEIATAYYGVPQSLFYNVQSIYGGQKIIKSGTDVLGWNFTNNTNGYNIGNYPSTDILNKGSNSLMNGTNLTGLWSAAPEALQKAEAKAMIINDNNMISGTILDFGANAVMKPQMAMNVRCVKQQDIYRGDNGRVEIPPVKCESGTLGIQNNSKKESLDIFPNPFTNQIHINQKGKFDYQLYDTSGRLVKSGLVDSQIIMLEELVKGVYILKLSNHETKEVVTKKIIKN